MPLRLWPSSVPSTTTDVAVIEVSAHPVTIPPAASSRPNVNRTSPLSRTTVSTSAGNAKTPVAARAPFSSSRTGGPPPARGPALPAAPTRSTPRPETPSASAPAPPSRIRSRRVRSLMLSLLHPIIADGGGVRTLTRMLLQACLNGSRGPGEHPALPLTAGQLAADARRVMAAGARSLHVHPRGPDGRETLDPALCAAALGAIRHACPGLPVGLSTGSWIEPDADRRRELIVGWMERPDFASVNFSEPGAVELCDLLSLLGIGVGGGVWSGAA